MLCINIVIDILKDSSFFHEACLIKSLVMIRWRPTIFFLWICFMNLNILFITLNILAPTSDISSTTTIYNCWYQHINLSNEFDNKFGKLNNDYWTSLHQYIVPKFILYFIKFWVNLNKFIMMKVMNKDRLL